jgi:hypothetical protein|tara:strand:- start:174 stop:392 length:219 start_codon:yes stop_codon:yes gene_type:complete
MRGLESVQTTRSRASGRATTKTVQKVPRRKLKKERKELLRAWSVEEELKTEKQKCTVLKHNIKKRKEPIIYY